MSPLEEKPHKFKMASLIITIEKFGRCKQKIQKKADYEDINKINK